MLGVGWLRQMGSVALVVAAAGLACGGVRADDAEVLKKIPPERMEQILKELGLAFERVDQNGVTAFDFLLAAYPVRLFTDGSDLQMFAIYEQKPDAKKINDWNRTRRFSRAFLNEEGNACLDCDLAYRGGTTPGAVKDFILVFRQSVEEFFSFLKQ